MIIEWLDVPADAWRPRLDALCRQGLRTLSWLTAADDGPEGPTQIAVMARVCGVEPASTAQLGDPCFVRTRIALGAALADVADLFPAAAWHQREVAEMFGVAFVGAGDPKPLFLEPGRVGPPPMLRSTALPRRAARPWPGHYEPSGRRARSRPAPGIDPGWGGVDGGPTP